MYKTEKLYDMDAYLTDFEATVLSVEDNGDGTYSLVLDKTAFFPNEGGQSADTGTVAGVDVLDVRLRGDTVVHIIRAPITVGFTVKGRVNFEERFEKMQCHTAEHIVCGLIHKLYGYDNVGFHLGELDVTFDVSGPLTRQQLDCVEDLANKAVTDNLAVRAYYPDADALSAMQYRAKLSLAENVRIVEIGEVDACACCAPHVARTGEIGHIRLLEFERHRGGTRIRLLAGSRALREERRIFTENHRIATALSVTRYETSAAVSRLEREISELKYALKEQKKREMMREAEHLVPTCPHPVVVLDGADADAMRAFANAAVKNCDGILAVISDAGEGRHLLLASAKRPLREYLPTLRESLAFRGGGSDAMVSGTAGATVDEIRSFFSSLA